jgi:phospholipid/cholesterol/gamma-HCH transport system substrate-binding protein
MQAVVLGAVVVAGLGLGTLGLFAIGNRQWLGDAFHVTAGFADIGGVEVGTRVRIQGIDAGEVVAIVPPTAAGDPVKLKLRLAGRLRHLVGSDARVQIQSEGLLSGKVVRVLPGSPGTGPVADGANLAARDTPDLTENLAQASAKLDTVLVEIGSALKEFKNGEGPAGLIAKDLGRATTKLNSVLARADRTLEAVEKGEGTLGLLLKNDSLYTELASALGQLNGALKDVRDGEGTIGKLAKSNEIYTEAMKSLNDVRNMVASVKANSDAIKAMPVVRSYVVDAHKELIRPDAKRHRRWYRSSDLFEPDRAVLSEGGKKILDRAAQWLNDGKSTRDDVVIAAFADPSANPEGALTLTQKQSEAILDYLRSNHRIHRVGWWYWSNRNVRALGVGTTPPAMPDSAHLPAARVDLLVFVPEG